MAAPIKPRNSSSINDNRDQTYTPGHGFEEEMSSQPIFISPGSRNEAIG
jgi:hypothetical protein